MIDIFNFIEEVQEQIGIPETFKRARAFMAAYLALFTYVLPDVVIAGLDVMRRFSQGKATTEEVEAARVSCWKFLDAKSASTDFTERENCAVRAAICLLYPDAPAGDLSELVVWFLSLANKVEDHTPEIDSLLNGYFLKSN
jgi:hypothetical protein